MRLVVLREVCQQQFYVELPLHGVAEVRHERLLGLGQIQVLFRGAQTTLQLVGRRGAGIVRSGGRGGESRRNSLRTSGDTTRRSS